MSRTWFIVLISLLAAGPAARAEDLNLPSDQLRFFELHVRPVLATRCTKCHGSAKQQSGLRLDSRAAVLEGGQSGPAVSLEEPAGSLLLEAINHRSLEMPPDGKLPDHEIAALTRWVLSGAPWPAESDLGRDLRESAKITAEDRAFWSFQPLMAVHVPQVEDANWCRNPIDQFVLNKLRQQGLEPAPPADRRTLIRRAYFDLLGLPPSPEEVATFVNDPSPHAWEALIDRLLNSPHYGERWARHWLDLVRYAESDGFNQDAYRPDAWRYRDYVIRSLNDDKPYDQFVVEQLAGDELAPHDPDALIATGYLRHWIYEFNQRDARTQWNNILNDVTDVTADVFLGLGMGCARCHDHKFDPILQTDYFRLQAFFSAIVPGDNEPIGSAEELAEYDEQLAQWEEATADVRHQLAALEGPLLEEVALGQVNKFPPDIRPIMHKAADQRGPLDLQLADLVTRQVQEEQAKIDFSKKLNDEQRAQWETLREQLAALEHLKPPAPATAMVVRDVGPEAPPTYIPGDQSRLPVQPGFPLVLGSPPPQIDGSLTGSSQSTGRRSALAAWIASPDNPLTTRVIVNRIWQYHFGRGLVATPSDFGRLGERPTHPELLDYLTREFLDAGWRLKHLHRMIMTSATYQQSALREMPATARREDPQNSWLWRGEVRRLDAEQIRDAMLSVSGELDLAAGGLSAEETAARRSIYTRMIRNQPDPLLSAFDAPDSFGSTAQRNVTTTPTQALLMINGQWTLKRAEAMAQRLQSEHGDDLERIVEHSYRLAFARSPAPDERQAAVQFLQRHETALTDYCHVLLNSNEFLYVD